MTIVEKATGVIEYTPGSTPHMEYSQPNEKGLLTVLIFCVFVVFYIIKKRI